MSSTEPEHLRTAIIRRADELGMTAYAISVALDRQPSPESLRRYMAGRCTLGSQLLDRVCEYLELELKPKGKR